MIRFGNAICRRLPPECVVTLGSGLVPSSSPLTHKIK